MSQPPGASGVRAGFGIVGRGSSMWSSPLTQTDQVPWRQIQNFSPTAYNNDRANVPPYLRQPDPTQRAMENQDRTPNSKLAFIPPHLRGFNTPTKANTSPGHRSKPAYIPKANASPGHHTPPIKSVSFNIPQDSSAPPTTPVTNLGTQRQLQQPPNHDVPAAVQPPTKPQEAATMHPVQPIPGVKASQEDAFLSFMKKKVSNDQDAKKKAAAEKVRSNAVQPEPVPFSTVDAAPSWPEAQAFVPPPLRPKVLLNAETDKAFQAFIGTQIKNPATNGKKYTYAGDQQAPQAPVPSKPVEKGGNNLQTMSIKLNARASSFGKADLHSVFSPRNLGSKLSPPLMSNDVAALSSTPDGLVEAGFEPQTSSGEFYDKISDTGVGVKAKENVRASQGQDPKEEFLDWDGKSWRPAPINWETDRGDFDNSFMPKYVREDWEPSVPRGSSVAIDTRDPKYNLAVWVGEKGFEAPIDHPMTIPDVTNSENEKRRRNQTSDAESQKVQKKAEMRNKTSQKWAEAQVARNLQIEAQEEEKNLYTPKIDMYLRPATENDAKGILDIYNHYVLNTISTEDQAAVAEDDIDFLIKHTKSEKLPIIVAVRGKMPLPSETKPLNRQKGKAPLPQFEVVIGFGYAETYCYGIRGGRFGRTRFTANLQFYVHPEFTRKRVGQSLLDRLIQSMSHAYGAKDGYDWINLTDDPVYKAGGIQRWHQLLIQYAVLPKDDPNYEMMTDYLRRFYFFEEGRVGRIARSSPSGNEAHFADIIFFAKEASDALEFAPIL